MVERLEGRALLSGGASDAILQAYGQLPLRFEANQGQTAAQVSYLARGSGYTVFLTATEAVMTLQATPPAQADGSSGNAQPPEANALCMQYVGANPQAQVVALDQLPGTSNYFTGNDSSQWHTGVSGYGRVEYQGIYPGIDLALYGNQGQMEYDYIVAPGADVGLIKLAFQGAESSSLDAQGDLVLHTSGGDVVEQAPCIYQMKAGVRQTIPGQFVVESDGQVGFSVGSYDPSLPLTIDPTLVYSTYLGGSGGGYGNGIAVDSAGCAYVTGTTSSTNFPTTPGALQTSSGGGQFDTFVTKLAADGKSLVYSTYLDGSNVDEAYGIAVDSAGHAYVTGQTDSTNFPTTPGAFQTSYGGGQYDAFVTELAADGKSLVYSTYLGGSGGDYGQGIAVDSAGHAYVTGFTASSDFPTTPGAFQTSSGHTWDAFVTKLAADGKSLVYSTYLGGSSQDGQDLGYGIAVDSAGCAYVTGSTTSTDFPTTPGAFQTSYGGSGDAFVTKLAVDGKSLVYSTYLGGSGGCFGHGIAVDSAGYAYVTGRTGSNFPTTPGAFQTIFGGELNAFVTKLAEDGKSLVYSTYLGGSGEEDLDSHGSIAVDSAGHAYVTGQTNSTNFPTTPGAYQTVYGGGTYAGDAFVTELATDGKSLAYSTYLGGSSDDGGTGIALDSAGYAYVTGYTASTDFPTTPGAFQTSNPSGAGDAFVTKLATAATGTTTTTTAVSVPPGTLVYGQAVTFTAIVTALGTQITPTGTVQFVIDDSDFGSAVTLVNGAATIPSPATLGAGNHTISAIYSGDANCSPSTSPDVDFTVAKAHLTVTADAKSMLYGGTVPGLTATITGFVNGDPASVVSGTASLSTTATSTSPVGAYLITVGAGTLSAANYDFPNLVNGTLTINQAHLTVTANSLSKTQGTPNPTLTYVITGFVNGENATTANVTGTPNLSTTAVTSSPPGAYPITITAGTLAAPNYDFPILVNGTLTVTVAGQTTVNVGSTLPNSTYGQSASFTVTVTPPTGGPTPTGQVQFLIDGSDFGSAVTLVSGAATSGAISTLSATTHVITADYLGDSNYPTNSGTYNQVVNKAHLTVTANAQSMLYGGSVPALTATITGFVNGDTSSVVSGTPGLGTSATSASPAGTYPITVAAGTLSAANYDFPNLVNGTLTINRAHLTVTADAKSMLYGGSMPVLTATITGFVNGDTVAVVSGSSSLSTTATSSSPAGSYPITVAAGTLSATNYDFPNLVNGTLTINKALLTVTAVNETKKQGAANPALTYTITGFVNGDKSTVVKGKPTLSTTAVKTSKAGSYPIYVALGTLSVSNYYFTLVPGKLTVTG
jgi:hypothetical protein